MPTRLMLSVTIVVMASFARPAAAEEASLARYFEQAIRPVLESHCIKCHGERKQEGGLRLDSRSAVLQGGDSGPAVVPGEVDDSLLIAAVRHEGFEMPPDGQLSAEEIQHLVDWIAAGAEWPTEVAPLREATGRISDEDRAWWAFQPLVKPEVPRHTGDDWSRTAIDAFVLEQMASNHIAPAPEADEETLVRRLYFDLIGLPPTPQEINEYLGDPSPDRWNRLIDRLLADDRYGEHWARFWLDLVRYAESDGWKSDTYRPHMWRYRDYVVNAFNDDRPYSQFVRDQLAGDEVAEDDPAALAAAGFLRLGIFEYNQRNARQHWDDILNEITDVTGDVFLGMSMACARCHDHKFDPVLQKDYFALRAFFEPLLWRDAVVEFPEEECATREDQQALWEEATKDIRSQLDALSQPHLEIIKKSVIEKFPVDIQASYFKPSEERTTFDHQMMYLMLRQVSDEGGSARKVMKREAQKEYDRLVELLAQFEHLKPPARPVLMTVTNAPGEIAPTRIPGGTEDRVVEPGFLSVLGNDSSGSCGLNAADVTPAARRSVLADWIASPDNPLTMRVIVNRIWQQHFGRGIVSTVSDFGRSGKLPTHPALLDWLTVEFLESGGRMKHLHRLILNSATWRQSSDHPEATTHERIDPEGDLLWRFRVRRLNAEQIRDAMLCAAGELERASEGESVESAAPRRSLYVKVYRNTPDEFLHTFDMANGLKSVGERLPTTTPTQSLLLINGSYALARAKAFAGDLLRQQRATCEEVIVEAIRRTWGRRPTPGEFVQAIEFLGIPADNAPSSISPERLEDFCHVLLNSNEFLYVD